MECTIKGFCAALVLGMGFRLGWGLVGLIFGLLANAAGSGGAFLK